MKNTKSTKASIAPNLTDKAALHVQQYATKQDITLHKTDPEFMENFWNFAYDEADSHSALDAPTKWKLQLGAVIAYPPLFERELLWRLLHAQRARLRVSRAFDICDFGEPWRGGLAGQSPCAGQPKHRA